MTQPSRLLYSEDNPAARALLEAGLQDAPARDAARRTALALGLGASALATVVSGSAGAAVGTGVGGVGVGLGAPAAASSLLAVAGQWLALGAVVGGALATSAIWLSSPAPQEGTPLTSAAAQSGSHAATGRGTQQVASDPAPARAPATPPAASGPPGEAGIIESALPFARSLSARTSSASITPSPPSADGSLAREVELIDQARRALAVGNPLRAQRALAEYAMVTRTGTLDREAQILRIETLLARGQRAAAVALARVYVSANPGDPHVPKLQALIGSALRAGE